MCLKINNYVHEKLKIPKEYSVVVIRRIEQSFFFLFRWKTQHFSILRKPFVCLFFSRSRNKHLTELFLSSKNSLLSNAYLNDLGLAYALKCCLVQYNYIISIHQLLCTFKFSRMILEINKKTGNHLHTLSKSSCFTCSYCVLQLSGFLFHRKNAEIS